MTAILTFSDKTNSVGVTWSQIIILNLSDLLNFIFFVFFVNFFFDYFTFGNMKLVNFENVIVELLGFHEGLITIFTAHTLGHTSASFFVHISHMCNDVVAV